jgi:hypothetical protein
MAAESGCGQTFSPVYASIASNIFSGCAVPIRPYAQDGAFSLEDVTALANAFEDALRSLGLRHRSDVVVLSVASRIIELARHGERNPTRLRDCVLNEFQAESGSKKLRVADRLVQG